jgi:hypothetical protein
LNRAEWFLCFLDASRAPVRSSGPAVDRAEWLSVFLAAADTHVSRIEDTLHHAERGAVKSPGEELASESSGARTQEESKGQERTRQAVRKEERHTHGEAT